MQPTPEVDTVILLPGQYSVGDSRCRMQTLLGPGVVITFWHGARRIGAMAHFLASTEGIWMPLELDGHSAPDGLELVLQELRRSQIDTAECVARICGSGNVISATDRVPRLNTGQASGDFARRLLRACGLPIASERFYPVSRHNVIFNVSTGRVCARRIKPVVVTIDAQPKARMASTSPTVQNCALQNTRAK